MALGIRRGDEVVVLNGDDKGKKGKVLHVNREKRKVIVQNVNYIWKHVHPGPKNPRGGRVQKEAPMDLSKVALLDPDTGKPTRFRNKSAEGTGADARRGKSRVAVKSGKPIAVGS